MPATAVTELLSHLQSPNDGIRRSAEAAMTQAADANFAGFLTALIRELRDDTIDKAYRQQAGVYVKNGIAPNVRDEATLLRAAQRWRQVDPAVRVAVKADILATLATSDRDVRRTAASMIASIARTDLPVGEWNDLIQVLCAAAGSQQDDHVDAALTAIGYICEECDRSDELTVAMERYSGDVLSAIFSGLSRPNVEVRYCSMNALCNAMDFIKRHMETPNEREIVMNAICSMASVPADATSAALSSSRIRQKAMEALGRVGALYYEHLGSYIDSIWTITMQAVEHVLATQRTLGGISEEELVAMQGFEFWMSVFETEKERAGHQHQTASYALRIQAQIFGPIGRCLMKQEEEQEEEDWNLCLAASKSLQFLADAVGDPIIGTVMPFVQQHIVSGNWREKDAALVAFGSILVGTDPIALKGMVESAIPTLLQLAQPNPENHKQVRDSAAWVLSLVAGEYAESFLTNAAQLQQLFNLVGPMLREEPMLAERACTVLHNLANFFYELDDEVDAALKQQFETTTPLSMYYADMMSALFAAMDRQDATDNLRANAQEAINMVIHACALDTIGVLENLVPTILARLGVLMQSWGHARTSRSVSLFIGSLNAVATKLEERMMPYYEPVMRGLLSVGALDDPEGNIKEEALMCISSMCTASPASYAQYADAVMPLILAAIQAVDQFDYCAVGIGTVGDICSALKQGASSTVAAVMPVFEFTLKGETIDQDIKVNVVNCLGDIALNTGPAVFTPYLAGCMGIVGTMLAQSLGLNIKTDDAALEFALSFWESVAHFFTGVMQGYREALDHVLPYTATIMNFISTVGPVVKEEDDTLEAIVTLIGDVANVVSTAKKEICLAARPQLTTQVIHQLLACASSSQNETLKEQGEWATLQVRVVQNGGASQRAQGTGGRR